MGLVYATGGAAGEIKRIVCGRLFFSLFFSSLSFRFVFWGGCGVVFLSSSYAGVLDCGDRYLRTALASMAMLATAISYVRDLLVFYLVYKSKREDISYLSFKVIYFIN